MTGTTNAGISAHGVARSFGEVRAVASASFEAHPGEITALIGPNGSGKTTLMLLLATLLRPDAGTLSVAGYDPVTHPQAVRARMGWMPDVLGSWTSLSSRATLITTGRLYGADAAGAVRRADELLDLVDLRELADSPTRVLSRGQKQRLSLARALVHDPEVLILDEPASGLDPGARIQLRDLMQRLAAEGRTVLVSSHVLAELDEVATAAVYLDRGATASAEAITQARTSTRLWRIRALAPPGARPLAAAVTELTGVAAQVDGDAALIPIASESDAVALLARLVAAGLGVVSFAPAVGELEHTFTDLNRAKRPAEES
ncbi:ABC transporter ATP-binding protein [Microbacteriaceae bacterium VKM Ac-2854]|nr:ABC transporter ATP-binding protein [Microbacteriaceae bacterium VKM Ac-2854]